IFDAIGVDLVNVHYAVLEAFCEGPWDQEPCNTPIAVSKPAYPLTIDYELTGATGINLGIVDDPEAVISESTTDYATLSNIVSAIGSLSIAVEDQITDYPAGTFVGFDIESTALLDINVLQGVSIATWLNGGLQETTTGTGLLIGADVRDGPSRQVVGFVTNTDVDKVQLIIPNLADVELGVTRVYSAIFQKFCEGEELPCNTQSPITAPDYPVYINGDHTGYT